ncbi:aldehyde dehydrogenase [Mucilaginibacter hurinus]|uniref:Aldehyde dehydrogenase n=1 Tax=Mucilaginibacter hurinus TaxID=2201324 RepID=A0A367GKB4_9SPHI|nr:PA2169 family four-helix-bundle protein [Mucilaginibacter hurinus]RCH53902.1 aldehyde dehydrogenase [Mucilaginibacter hurinus]
MDNTQITIEALNDLVQINNDRIRGFELALKKLTDNDAGLRRLFLDCIADSHRFKMQLGTEIEALNQTKDIENTTTFGGAVHRAWIELKGAFSDTVSARSILEECEFGEDSILKAYQLALDDENMPAYIREMLTAQYDSLQDSHEEIRALRDSA